MKYYFCTGDYLIELYGKTILVKDDENDNVGYTMELEKEIGYFTILELENIIEKFIKEIRRN